MDIRIDIDRLNSRLAEKLPQHAEAQAIRAETKVANFAGLSAPDIGGVIQKAKSTKATICNLWPKFYETGSWLVHTFGFFAPGASAEFQVVLDGLNEELYPALCPKAAPKP